MAAVAPNSGGPILLDGVPLKIRLERAERMRKIKAVGLILPLFVFLMVTFAVPIFLMLVRGVENPEIVEVLPRSAAEMRLWDGNGFPSNEAMQIFAAEVVSAQKAKTLGKAAKRLNYHASGFRSLLFKTGTTLERAMKKEGEEAVLQGPEMLKRFIGIDKRWGERRYWTIVRQASPPHTAWYLLRSVDRDYNEDSEVVRISEDQAIHVAVLWRTIVISAVVTILCLLFGFPIAYLLGTLPTKQSNLLILLLLLPFWTSLLVRTTAWLVLLQNEGVINDLAIYFGLWDEPLQLVRNRMGTYIAMVHILLPFMVLPMFSVMKGIEPYHMKAAASLGANPVSAFIKVYLPQTLPGVGAGVLLVFILSLGYYITPALVGGPSDQMLSYFIAFHVNTTVNWGLAAALSALLLVCVMIFFAMYQRLVGVGNIRMN